MQKNCILFVALCMFLTSCDLIDVLSSSKTDNLPLEIIRLPGVDYLSIGGTFHVSVRTQGEYETLLYERYQKPLNDYCNEHFNEERERLIAENPSLTDEEIQALLNDICIEKTPIFNIWNLQDVEHPQIDFSEYTLLGQDAHGGGCTAEYDPEVYKTENGYTFHITVSLFGSCSMAINRNFWVLIPAIPGEDRVEFTKEYVQKPYNE